MCLASIEHGADVVGSLLLKKTTKKKEEEKKKKRRFFVAVVLRIGGLRFLSIIVLRLILVQIF